MRACVRDTDPQSLGFWVKWRERGSSKSVANNFVGSLIHGITDPISMLVFIHFIARFFNPNFKFFIVNIIVNNDIKSC